MPDKYSATSLAQSNDPLEIQKADLDLLKKINEAYTTLVDAEAASVASLQAQIDALKAGKYVPAPWVPYPAGTYSFPSGNQTASAGDLLVGATVTAPAWGTTSTKKAWYRDNGKTIDIMGAIHQTASAGAAAGSGYYVFSLPLGKSFDTSVCQIGTPVGLDGQNLGFMFVFATGYTGTGPCLASGTNLISGNFIWQGASAGQGVWGSAAFPPPSYALYHLSFTILGIPVL
jgi:hypothetical protein